MTFVEDVADAIKELPSVNTVRIARPIPALADEPPQVIVDLFSGTLYALTFTELAR